MKHRIFSFLLCIVPAFAGAQVASGYYTISTPSQLKAKYNYTYDATPLRDCYGNEVNWDYPMGRNGEHAYLYAQPSVNASQANQFFYIQAEDDGRYTIQSCSGEAFSYLSVATYDRRLAYFTTKPQNRFTISAYDWASPPQWDGSEHVLQPFKYAANFEALACQTPNIDALSTLTPVGTDKIKPAIRLRRTLSDAKGVLSDYPAGDNPGQVSPLISATLRDLIAEAESIMQTATEEEADKWIERLREAAADYAMAATTMVNPVTEGYYFLVSAYRPFEGRQNKQKAMTLRIGDDATILAWDNLNVNDGCMAFHLIEAPSGAFTLQAFNEQEALQPLAEEPCTVACAAEGQAATFLLNSEAEGMWNICLSTNPQAKLVAANPSTGRTGLYGKASSDVIHCSSTEHLFAGHIGSWFLQPAYHSVNVLSTGWAGMTTSFPVRIPEGVTIYTVRQKDDGLHAVPYSSDVIPAGTAVIVKASKGTYLFPSLTDEQPLRAENILLPCPTARRDIIAGTMALLKVRDGQVGFAKSTQTTLAAGQIYLPYAEGMDEFRPLIIDEPSSVEQLEEETFNKQAPIYNLSGQQISRPQRGIYIQNNKKILKP